MLLTLFDAADQIFQKVDGDALGRGQVGKRVDRQELVHLVLGAELRRELRSGDLPWCLGLYHVVLLLIIVTAN